ncbi:uncharacterized protein LOC110675945 [Aedes aegypti]|uniref:Uncharacterized protein n=1 Tax=Aedes aegypti TaxID=7159 RepID=A0A6I8U5A9_AEDAE|nr:uncharacterized protein LOC110675945 [Aedes aegypti]
MKAVYFLCQIVFVGVIMKEVSTEECIKWQDHRKELENCCKYYPPYPQEGLNRCSKPALEQSGRDEAEYLRCLFECYFDRLGIVVDQTLDLDKVAEHLQSMSENSRDIVLNAYKKCAAETTGSLRVCHSYAQELEACALLEIDRHCPDEFYEPNEICDKRRAGVEFCE